MRKGGAGVAVAFQKNVAVFLVSFGVGWGVGGLSVVCLRRGVVIVGLLCVGSRGYGSWCGARHPQPWSGGYFLVLGSLLSVGVSLAWVAPPPSLGGGATRGVVARRL